MFVFDRILPCFSVSMKLKPHFVSPEIKMPKEKITSVSTKSGKARFKHQIRPKCLWHKDLVRSWNMFSWAADVSRQKPKPVLTKRGGVLVFRFIIVHLILWNDKLKPFSHRTGSSQDKTSPAGQRSEGTDEHYCLCLNKKAIDFLLIHCFLTAAEEPHRNVSITKDKVKLVPLKKGTSLCLHINVNVSCIHQYFTIFHTFYYLKC